MTFRISLWRITAGAFLYFASPSGPLGGEALPEPPSGWKIEVVAEAPDVKHPSVVCAAPDGRVFVAEDPMDISVPAHASQGRIICFHPDGKRTVFAENLYAVFGMQYLAGKLFVLHNPKFSVFEDAGEEAGSREDLIESTNPNPWALEWNDHVPANFQLGMDGYFYVAVGDKGIYGAVGRDGKRLDLHGGGIIRIRPDGTGLEVFCTGVRNILDVAMNEEDEMFTYDNTDEQKWMGRVTHMVDGGFYGYPYDFIPQRPYTLWMLADYGAGAATGAFAYNEDALPDEYRGNLFLADFGKKQIMRVKVGRTNGTYDDFEHVEVFENVPPLFRPVGICPSADGMSIYICDWQHLDVKENVTVGRLLKMSYTGVSRAAAKPEWHVAAAQGAKFEATTGELVQALGHPSRSVRIVAQRELVARKEMDALIRVLGDGSAPVRAKWHAIWGCDALDQGEKARKEIGSLSRGVDKSLRRQAIRQLGERQVKEAREDLEKALEDADGSIRFYAATALGRIGAAESIPALQKRAGETELFPRYALFYALRRIGMRDPSGWSRINEGLQTTNDLSFFALREVYEDDVARRLAGLVGDANVAKGRRVAALNLLLLIHHRAPEWKGEWWAYHPVNVPPPEKNVEWEGTKAVRSAVRQALSDPVTELKLLGLQGVREMREKGLAAEVRKLLGEGSGVEIRREALATLAVLKDREAVSMVNELLRGNDPELLTGALEFARKVGGADYGGSLLALLQNGESTAEVLALALKLAPGQTERALAAAVEKFVTHPEESVRKAALEGVVKMNAEKALRYLQEALRAEDAGRRRTAVQVLAGFPGDEKFGMLKGALMDREIRAEALLALTQTSSVELVEIYLEALGEQSARVREGARKALQPLATEAWPKIKEKLPQLSVIAVAELQRVYAGRAEILDQIRATARVPAPEDYFSFATSNLGDPSKGYRLFRDENGLACSKCHKVGHEGAAVGPDLTAAGTQFSKRELAEHILYPSKSVREGYENYIVETKEGESYSGLFKGETAEEIRLLDSSGTMQRIPLREVKSRRKSDLSLMPEGLHTALQVQDFADLIAYLETLKPRN